MRADRIHDVLDLAIVARKLGLTFNPMFIGEAGLGKSEVVWQWAQKQKESDPSFGCIDLRIAYMEAPDFIGFPHEYQDVNDITRMGHALPDFWPTEGRGILFLEEINRGNTMVMNCLMQLTTTRGVGPKYVLPEGWIIASAINPEGAKYDVNNMDTALMDRFEKFVIEYDYQTFMNYIEIAGWNPKVVQYLKTGNWVYHTPDHIATGGSYISPRTWYKMHVAEMSGASENVKNQQMHRIIAQAILGKHVGNEYWKFCWDDAPILASDLIEDKVKALKELSKQSKAGNTYAGDKIAVTVESIISAYGGWFEGKKDANGKDSEKEADKIDEPTMVEVAMIIPSDQSVNLIKGCGFKTHHGQMEYLREFQKRNPKCIDIMRDHIKIDRAIKGHKS